MTKEEAKDIAITSAYKAFGSSAGAYGFLFDAGVEFATPKWIPVSERLPDTDGWYAVTVNDNDGFPDLVEPYWYDIEGWSDGQGLYIKDSTFSDHILIAWMPLPEPYRQGE